MLQYLVEHRQPGDVIHVFPLARIGLLFYGPRHGLKPEDWSTTHCDADDTRTYLRDVDRHRGASRLWVLSSQVIPFLPAHKAVRDYLGAIGIRRDRFSLPSLIWGTVDLDLYDLGDPARLAAANAETFAVQPMPTV